MGHQIKSMGNLKNMMSSISLVGDAKRFQEGKGKFDALREKLENKSEKRKLDAMSSRRINGNKKICIYACNSLLSISSFQNDMASPNPLVRANSLHAMLCRCVKPVTHLIILALKNAVKDSSPYVHRTASQVLLIINIK
eukprot:531913_1